MELNQCSKCRFCTENLPTETQEALAVLPIGMYDAVVQYLCAGCLCNP